MKYAMLLGLGALAGSSPAFADSGNTASASGSVVVNVITPIELTHLAGATLNFGSFTTGSGGTVVVGADNRGTTTLNVSFVPGSQVAADQFTVKGDPNRNFAIATLGGAVSNGQATISFTTAPSTTAATINPSGTAAFSVGGTLTLDGTEVAGNYTGSYSATVTYN